MGFPIWEKKNWASRIISRILIRSVTPPKNMEWTLRTLRQEEKPSRLSNTLKGSLTKLVVSTEIQAVRICQETMRLKYSFQQSCSKERQIGGLERRQIEMKPIQSQQIVFLMLGRFTATERANGGLVETLTSKISWLSITSRANTTNMWLRTKPKSLQDLDMRISPRSAQIPFPEKTILEMCILPLRLI